MLADGKRGRLDRRSGWRLLSFEALRCENSKGKRPRNCTPTGNPACALRVDGGNPCTGWLAESARGKDEWELLKVYGRRRWRRQYGLGPTRIHKIRKTQIRCGKKWRLPPCCIRTVEHDGNSKLVSSTDRASYMKPSRLDARKLMTSWVSSVSLVVRDG